MMGSKSSKKRKDGCFTAKKDSNDTTSNSAGKFHTECINQEEHLISNESKGQKLGDHELESEAMQSGNFALVSNNPGEGSDVSGQETLETETQERDCSSGNRTMEQELAPQMAEPQPTARPIQEEQTNLSLVSPCPTQTSAEEQDVNANGELTSNSDGGKRNVEFMQEPVSEKIINNPNLMQSLTLRLDQYHPAVKNWRHLAYALDPETSVDIIAKCTINAEYSAAQRFLQFLEVKQPNIMVEQFVSNLEEIKRNDIKKTITETLKPGNNKQRISEVFNNNAKLYDEIVLQLDTKSPVKKGWKHLACEFKIENPDVKRIESGCRNPAAGIMGYVFKKEPNLTVGDFKKHMSEMKRMDVLSLLPNYNDKTEKLEKIMPRDSDLFEDVTLYLNENAGGSLKYWRHFASRLKIPSAIYDSFDPEKPHSPTEMLLDWFVGMNPEFTVGQLCKEIQSIDRNDVFELIISTLQKP